MKAIGSIAFIIGKYGSVSADYEIVDYSNMKLRAQDYNFNLEKRCHRPAIRVNGKHQVRN